MEYRRFPMSCECGGEPKQILAVGFSADREMVVHWRCPKCHRRVCTVRPLAECWNDCFGAPEAPEAPAGPPQETPDDLRFLHSIGVKFAE
ncbi:MAG TPA: hypothetical protein VHW09_23170 [Bryobacteraceae bacterium]|jgi:hypothetical protein|nr:hypothetical protein [Bryobacteraceae bacterium]